MKRGSILQRPRLRVHKETEWNRIDDHKEMKKNEMYLSEGNEWKKKKRNEIELSNLVWMF